MPASLVKKKILIVEDDPDMLQMLSTLLREAGFEVAQAEHALGAVCSVVRASPDLVLADIRLPILNGLDLISELKAHQDTRHIPIVALTGYDTQWTRESAFKAGCDGYITKPIDARSFPDQISEFLNQPAKTQASG